MIPPGLTPAESYNGITVAASMKAEDGVYRRVADFNDYSEYPTNRTITDLIAPGDNIDVENLIGPGTMETGTSFATPHVTGTAALLQHYANLSIADNIPR